MCEVDLLILFSDVNGLFLKIQKNKNSELIKEINNITHDIELMAGPSKTSFSNGGMVTKIQASKIATNAGVML